MSSFFQRLSVTFLSLAMVLGACLSVPAWAGEDYRPHAPQLPKTELRGQPTVYAGDFYYVGEQRFELHRRADELVVQFASQIHPAALASELLGSGGLLEGFEEVRVFGPGLHKFRDPSVSSQSRTALPRAYANIEQAMSQLSQRPDVAWVAPVFVNVEYQTYAVASDEVLVRLRSGVDAGRFFADAGVVEYRRGDSMDAFVARAAGGAGAGALALAAGLQGHPNIVWAEPNFYQERVRMSEPDDLLFPLQWHLRNTGQSGGTAGADANLVPAWAIEPGGSSDIVIAVLDDGIELMHPDLRIYSNPNEIENGVDSDGNGYIDDIRGWDFTSGGLGDSDPGASITADRHGTSVAGIAAGRGDNGIGITGAAYNASVLPVRIFLGPTPTSDGNIGTALAYASGRGRTPDDNNWAGAHIVNNSWGGGPPSSAINDALEWAAEFGRGGLGTPHFFATGNSGAASISLPAALSGTIESVIAVGASSHTDLRSSYSQFGSQLDFLAPSSGEGVGTVTTDRLGAPGYNGLPDLDYTNDFGGTSSATPLAAGVAGLILSRVPDISLRDIRLLMRASADKIGPLAYDDNGFNVQYGYGRINAHTALQGADATAMTVSGPDGVIDSGDVVELQTVAGDSRIVRVNVASAGLGDPLELGPVSLLGDAAFTLTEGFNANVLEIGEATYFEIAVSSNEPGSFGTVATFTSNVPGDESFSVQFSLDVLPVSIGGIVFEDWSANGEPDPGDPLLEGVLVFLDLNDDGELEPPERFDYFDPVNLPFGASPTAVSSSIDVSGLANELLELEVLLNINHAWVGDVRVQLTSPEGQTITLINQAGGGLNSGQNFINTRLTDSAASSIQAITPGGAPYTGSFRPAEPFSTLFGQSPNGNWTLTVTDLFAPEDDGVFIDWTLTVFAGGDPFRFSDAEGRYSFVGLEPGSYVVRSVGPEDWIATAPAAGSHLVVIDNPLSNNPENHFGYYRPDAIYGRVFLDETNSGASDPLAPGMAGVAVFIDLDDDGEFSDVAQVVETASPDVAIPDNNAAGVSSAIELAGFPPTRRVMNVEVELDITHTFVGDLEVFLQAPGQQEIRLINRRGGSGDNFTGTILADDADLPISGVVAGNAPFTGRYRPETPLSTFRTGAINGDWVLRVADRASLDTGTLNSWTLTVEYQTEPVELTNEFGNYRIDRGLLPAGPHRVRAVVAPPYLLTFPAEGSYEVSYPVDDSVHLIDFGVFLPDGIFGDRFESAF